MTINPRTIAADIMCGNARDIGPSEIWAHIGQAYDATDIDAAIADEVAELIAKTGIDLIWPDGTKNTELDAVRVEIERLIAELAEARKQVCLIVTCQGCGEAYEYDGGTVHFSNPDQAQSMVEDDEWRRIGNEFVCGGCIYEPHPFTPGAPPMELTCQRCDLEEDDHEAASTATEAVAR